MRVLKCNIPLACILIFAFLFFLKAYAQECNNQSIFPGDIIEFGNYEQDNNLENGFEPVEWIVLDIIDGKVLLISRYGLDMKQYNETLYAVPWGRVMWENSSLRSWLNCEFYNECFSEFEREKIVKTEVVNGFTKYSHIDGGSNTKDNIFLLSIDEAERYFDTDKERICYVTKYATAREAWTEYDGTCWWWLRSPGEPVEYAAHIFVDGSIHIYGNRLSGIGGAVRPSLWISLEKTDTPES